MASAITDSILEESRNDPKAAPLAYFYCASYKTEPQRSNPDEIMRSLVRQLAVSAKPDLQIHHSVIIQYDILEAQAKIQGFDVKRLDMQDCTKLILEITIATPIIIIVDAVDEIDCACRHELLHALQSIVKDAPDLVKVFLTSRNDSQISALLNLGEPQTININTTDNREDMRAFVQNQISRAVHSGRLIHGNPGIEFEQQFASELLNKASEMWVLFWRYHRLMTDYACRFLWVRQSVEYFCGMPDRRDILHAIRYQGTASLTGLYDELYARITGQLHFARSVASKTFMWLLCSQHSLSLDCLIAAITASSESEDQEVMSPGLFQNSCSNLIVFDPRSRSLRFAHISVQEFLQERAELNLENAHKMAAISCMNACMQASLVSLDLGLHPATRFDHYSIMYWPHHYKNASLQNGNDVSAKLMEFTFDDYAEANDMDNGVSLAFVGWLDNAHRISDVLDIGHFMKKDLSTVKGTTNPPLFAACAFGLMNVLERLEGFQDLDWNQVSKSNHTGAYIAAAVGNRDALALLLNHTDELNVRCRAYDFPLHAACFGGHLDVAKLLLNHGANPQLSGSKFPHALQASLVGGHDGLASLLLQKGFVVADQEDHDRIVAYAAQAGSKNTYNTLRRRYASSFGQLSQPWNRAIEAAMMRGSFGPLQEALIDNFANFDLRADAVSIAALYGRKSLVLRWLDQGLEIEMEGFFGTPLRVTSLMGHEFLVLELLDRGANVNACGSFGSALQAAAMNGHTSVVLNLMNRGSDVNQSGGYYGNALQAAAYHGHLNVVEILLDNGAKVHAAGICENAIQAAVSGGQESILRLLLEKGHKTSNLSTVRRQMMEIVPEHPGLLRTKSPSRKHERSGEQRHRDIHTLSIIQTPSDNQQKVARASVVGTRPVLTIVSDAELLNNSSVTNKYFWTAGIHQGPADSVIKLMVLAAMNGHENVVRSLLDHLQTLGVQNRSHDALEVAAAGGHPLVVGALLPIHDIGTDYCREDEPADQKASNASTILHATRPCSVYRVGKWPCGNSCLPTQNRC